MFRLKFRSFYVSQQAPCPRQYKRNMSSPIRACLCGIQSDISGVIAETQLHILARAKCVHAFHQIRVRDGSTAICGDGSWGQ
jgi:hypothetical protein